MKTILHSWGEEIIIGSGAKVVRLYVSAKKMTLDMSQVKEPWDKAKKVFAKYDGSTKIILPVEKKNAILAYFLDLSIEAYMASSLLKAYADVP